MAKSTRYFEFVGEDSSRGVVAGSSKFWEVAVVGAELMVRFGRIGTQGRRTVKTLGSAEAAQAKADKLIGEKTRKGYVEKAPATGTAPARTLASPDLLASADETGASQSDDPMAVGANAELSGDLAKARSAYFAAFQAGAERHAAGEALLRVSQGWKDLPDQGAWIVDASGECVEDRWESRWHAEAYVPSIEDDLLIEGPFYIIDHEGNAYEVDDDGNPLVPDEG